MSKKTMWLSRVRMASLRASIIRSARFRTLALARVSPKESPIIHTAIAATAPRIATTMTASMSVKPALIFEGCMNPPL